MAAKLVPEDPSQQTLELNMNEGESWTIGRDSTSCQIVLQDPKASRKHAIFHNTDHGILVENLSTTNPILFNNQAITSPQLLSNGDALKIGSSWYHFDNAQEIPENNAEEDEEQPSEEPETPSEEPTNIPEEPIEKEEEEQPPEEEVIEEDEEQPSEEPAEKEQPIENDEDENIPEEPIETIPEEHIENDTEKHQDIPPQPEIKEEFTDAPITEKHAEDPLLQGLDNDFEEIDFSIAEEGRWLLKVLSGPNTGAEIYMEENHQYIIGSDAASSDIVLHDQSVSKKHASFNITTDDTVSIEDLNSRNGIFVDGQKITEKTPLKTGQIVTLGTTSLIIIDRENSSETIISPPLPMFQQPQQHAPVQQIEEPIPPPPAATEQPEEPEPENDEENDEDNENDEPTNEKQETPPPQEETPIEEIPLPEPTMMQNIMRYKGFIIAFFVLVVIVIVGISTLFDSSQVASKSINYQQTIENTIKPFPDVEYTYNNNSGKLFLLGHVLTFVNHSKLTYSLKQLPFITKIEDHIIIDEGVWQEMNQILKKAPQWRGVSVHSPKPGVFVMTGYLKTRKELDELNNYANLNFPFVERLDNQVHVEEEILDKVATMLYDGGFVEVTLQVNDGELTIMGIVPNHKQRQFAQLVESFKEIKGIRSTKNFTVTSKAAGGNLIDLSDEYTVSGMSKHGKTSVSVVINGKILTVGDALNGMTITAIKPQSVQLEKDGVKYKIDYNK